MEPDPPGRPGERSEDSGLPTSHQPARSRDGLFAGESLPSRLPPRYLLKQGRCGTWYERQGRQDGFRLIAGVDEVGRGALFGPVLAAAVILDPATRIRGIRDSKRLPANQRERLSDQIRRRALAWSIASVDAGEIDRINIYQASRLAMRQAVMELNPLPELVLVDALRLDIHQAQLPIIHGDSLSISIAAASIVAKVERDRLMREWDRIYPQYQLARNKGYATAAHRAMLRELGPTPQHRYSYAPVAETSQDAPAKPSWLFPAGV
ncbi:MAG: ribonuclease HII [Acidobacteria bacterium]|nr:ribonuclease HII [Acidobacteriota bacterium]